ncbi:MAG: putative protein-disulfide isomerase [Granulosicoccus sp.]|jgi:putative protein-disulfide isomerase
MAQSKAQLIYFGDPMCSWCYGFSPEMSEALDSLAEDVDFQIVTGGLRPYNTETMADLGDFLQQHWEDVNKRSGQPFSYEILKDKTFVYDTEPACRAVVLMRALKPESEFEFFKEIQTQFYQKNKNTNLTETYAELATAFGLNKTEFAKKFESDEFKEKVKEDFTYAQNIGVQSYPTLVLKNGDDLYLIAQGYVEAETIIEKCEKILLQKK